MMWSLFVYIENDPNLFNQFLSGPSRRILVTLTSLKVESDDIEFWRAHAPIVIHSVGNISTLFSE